MILRFDNPNISGNETTRLTSASAATATTLTVQNIEGFAIDDHIVLGKLGEEQTELVKLHASTAPTGSTITLSAATSFAHAVNTPITYIGFNQIAVYSATSKTGTYSEHGSSPTAIEVDQSFTEFDDTAGSSTTWYKIKYYNSTSAVYSSYSDVVQGTGYTDDSLRKIISKANALSNDRKNKILSEEEKIDIVNDGYQQVNNRLEKADHKRFIKKGYVDIKNSYNTGTIAVTVASTIVTSTLTTWDTSWANKKIRFNDEGYYYDISSVDSTIELTLSRAYQGESDLTNETYEIFQDEYDIYDASTGLAVTDFKKIEQVYNKDGRIINEYDLHRTENGYYLKRDDDNLKFCLNYRPDIADDEGRWMLTYRYQPTRLDSMADEPEFPQGYSGLLVSYLTAKIVERISMSKAKYYMGEYLAGSNKLIREAVPRTNEKKGFRIDRNLRAGQEHDTDWGDSIYSRKTIGT